MVTGHITVACHDDLLMNLSHMILQPNLLSHSSQLIERPCFVPLYDDSSMQIDDED